MKSGHTLQPHHVFLCICSIIFTTHLYLIVELFIKGSVSSGNDVIFSVCCSSGTWILLFAAYASYVMNRKASIHRVVIRGKIFWIHERDLRRLYPLIVDLFSSDVPAHEIETILSGASVRSYS